MRMLHLTAIGLLLPSLVALGGASGLPPPQVTPARPSDTRDSPPDWLHLDELEQPVSDSEYNALRRGVVHRLPELVETAEQANRGYLGCGIGSIRILHGERSIECRGGLDANHVFGHAVRAVDLFAILVARRVCLETKAEHFSSEESGYLAGLVLGLVWDIDDPNSISCAAGLLDDPMSFNRDYANWAILRVGHQFESRREQASAFHIDPELVEKYAKRFNCDMSWVGTLLPLPADHPAP